MVTNLNHPSHEDLSAYAIDALDPNEIQPIQLHLRTCAACQQILANYQSIAEGMLFAVPPQAPPPQLRARLARQVAAGRLSRPQPNSTRWPARPVFSFARLALGSAFLVLLFVILGLGLQVGALQHQQQALLKLIHDNQSSLALVSLPGIQTHPVTGTQGNGNLVVSPDEKTAVLFLQNMPSLDENHTYQVWLIPSAGAPVSVGLFQTPADQAYVPFLIDSQQPLKTFAAVGVTIEPKNGSKEPTTKPILLVNL